MFLLHGKKGRWLRPHIGPRSWHLHASCLPRAGPPEARGAADQRTAACWAAICQAPRLPSCSLCTPHSREARQELRLQKCFVSGNLGSAVQGIKEHHEIFLITYLPINHACMSIIGLCQPGLDTSRYLLKHS